MTPTARNGAPLVLVADDDGDLLDMIEFRFEDAHYDVLTATNGEEALELVLDRRPDLAVLDVKMPKLTGLDVLRTIRENEETNDTPVILLTAAVQETDIARGFEAGASDYMRKPFSPGELVVRVESLLGSR